MHELANLTRLSLEEKDALILAQFEQINRLTMLVQTFGARVRELEGRLRKDRHNSSKPPSSDGLAKKPKSLRQSSGRKPGGQAGYPGSTLKRVADPDLIVQHPLPEHCDGMTAGFPIANMTAPMRCAMPIICANSSIWRKPPHRHGRAR